jgi:DNA-directed RNA polymerase specialized sigma24 family protein
LRGLLDRCTAGEPEAWELFDRWARRTADRAIWRYLRIDDAEREDVTATVVERLVSVVRRGQIRGTHDGEIAVYVQLAARRATIDLLRQRRRHHHELKSDLLDPTPGPGRRVVAGARLRIIEATMQEWAADERYVLLAKLEGFPTRQIQQDLVRLFSVRIAARTVDTRYHRLRDRLRQVLLARGLDSGQT